MFPTCADDKNGPHPSQSPGAAPVFCIPCSIVHFIPPAQTRSWRGCCSMPRRAFRRAAQQLIRASKGGVKQRITPDQSILRPVHEKSASNGTLEWISDFQPSSANQRERHRLSMPAGTPFRHRDCRTCVSAPEPRRNGSAKC